MIRLMNKELLSLFLKVSDVVEFHVVRVDTHVSYKLSHFTIRGFVQIGQKTIFKLRILSMTIIVSDFIFNSDSECGSIS